jgi:uncharacterized protein
VRGGSNTPGSGGAARAEPISSTERIELLDALRGIALLGIFLINFNSDYLAPPRSLADKVVALATEFFIDGSFYPIFAFLFGVGFAIQLQRADARDARFAVIYTRRLVALFGIGMAHAMLIWGGDVLWRYALLGFPLLVARRFPSTVLLPLAGLLLTTSVLVEQVNMPASPTHAVAGVPTSAVSAAGAGGGVDLHPLEHAAIHEGSYGQLVRVRIQMVGQQVHRLPHDPWLLHVLAIFMLGLVAGRGALFRQPARHRVLLRRTMWAGAVVGLLGNFFVAVVPSLIVRGLVPATFSGPPGLHYIGDPALSCFYVAGLTLLISEHPAWRRRLGGFAFVGRMGLTNYLFQSLAILLLMAAFGLGFAFRVGHAVAVPAKLVIFGGQMAMSRWWLRRFQFGPMEWAWRWATYGKLPSLVRSSPLVSP